MLFIVWLNHRPILMNLRQILWRQMLLTATRALCIVVVRRHGQGLDSTEILASRRFGAGNHVVITPPTRAATRL
jgi:hypothetical protein